MGESRRAGTTTAGGVLAIVLSALWTLLGLGGVLIGLALALIDENDGNFLGFEDLFDFVGGVLAAVGVFVVVVGIWGIVVGVNAVKGKGWARVAGIVSFGIFALLSLGIIVERDPVPTESSEGSSVSTRSENDNVAAGIANLSACGLVVLLLAWPKKN